MKQAKKEKVCFICGVSNIDGCHILERGKTKYMQFADNVNNIVPMCRRHHRIFDSVDVDGKIDFLETYVLADYIYLVKQKIKFAKENK